jgi:hypothetical protein
MKVILHHSTGARMLVNVVDFLVLDQPDPVSGAYVVCKIKVSRGGNGGYLWDHLYEKPSKIEIEEQPITSEKK